MHGQIIPSKYLDELKEFFKTNKLMQPGIIWKNEEKFKEYLDVKTFKFVNSGTSALYLILNYLKTVKGKTVVWGPAFSHISWINCSNWLDMKHEFVDINESTLSLDPNKLLEKIKTDGAPDIVVMIDMGGYLGEDTLAVKQICSDHGIIMVEDAAHAFGQKYKGKHSGTIGDFGFYSFSTPKLLTAGEGGGLICCDADLTDAFDEAIYQGSWYKSFKTYYTRGLNFIMSNWLTELLWYQLRDIDEIMKNHYDEFQEYLKKSPNMITFESDNKFYAPSFFAYRDFNIPDENKTIKNIHGSPTLWGRYLNMADPEEFPVSQKVQETLLYWRL